MKFLQLAVITVLVWLVSCSPAVLPAPASTQERSTPLAAAPQASPETLTTATGPVTLRIWLPPQFDTDSSSPAGQLLRRRLGEFVSSQPNLRIEVRIKAIEGPAGLLDTLVAASFAAPQAVPDLIALSRPALEVAALKGLLHPFDDLSSLTEDPDWYDYARQLGRSQRAGSGGLPGQSNQFGLPFAGDALVLVYRPASIPRPPVSLTDTLTLESTLLLPAADPQALIPLALYQAAGGMIQDSQGQPMLDKASLSTVLSFFYAAGRTQVLPAWSIQYTNDAQSWEAFQNGQANLVITWASHYLSSSNEKIASVPIPTPGSAPFTYATGWTWALANPHSPNLRLSTQLAEFLSTNDFLAEFASSAGYLPLRSNKLINKQNEPQARLAYNQIAQTAQLIPFANLIASLAPPIQQAILQVLKHESDPATAANQAIKSLGGQ